MCADQGAAQQVVVSGVLPVLALALRHRGPLTLQTAQLVAELAGECELAAVWRRPAFFSDPRDQPTALRSSAVVRKGFGDAGLVPAVLSLLTSADRELLLYAARAVSRTCLDSRE